jgi:broad specificity phosphatase PhoE
VVAVYASDLLRAADTAAAIAAPHGLEVVRDARLREVDQGLLDGLSGEEMRNGHAEFIERWRNEDPRDLRIPGGETLGEAQARMVEMIEEIAAAERARDDGGAPVEATGASPRHLGGIDERPAVVVVSHNLALRVLLCHALRVPIASFRRFQHGVASLAEVEVRADAPWTVMRLNERCHLLPGDEMRSVDAPARGRATGASGS